MKKNFSPQLRLFENKEFRYRKVARPISARGFHHVVLKTNQPVLRLYRDLILFILRRSQLKYGIELKALSIMSNHVHLCIRTPNRICFANFLRMFAGQVAFQIKRGKLWTERAWSRIVSCRKDLLRVVKYIEGNPVIAGIFEDMDCMEIREGLVTTKPAL